MESVVSTMRRDIEGSQKSILAAVAEVAPSLSGAGAKLLEGIAASVAKNKAQTDDAMALAEKRTADIQESLGAHHAAMESVLSTMRRDIESSQKSVLGAVAEVAPSLSGAGAKLLEGVSASIAKNKAQTDTAVALLEKRASDIQGSLGTHSAAMEGIAVALRREIENSQKSILSAFSEVGPSLSVAGTGLLDKLSGAIANNKAQTDDAIHELMTAIDDFQKERENQIQGAVQEIASQMASSYGQIAVLFDVHGDDFASRLDRHIEGLRAELEERKRVIEDFLTTARASLSEEALRRLRVLRSEHAESGDNPAFGDVGAPRRDRRDGDADRRTRSLRAGRVDRQAEGRAASSGGSLRPRDLRRRHYGQQQS